MNIDVFAISALSAIAFAVLAVLTFSKQADLRPVPVRRLGTRAHSPRR